MGSPLGPSFPKCYLTNLKNKTFNTIDTPSMYNRCINDTFLPTDDLDYIKNKSNL